MLWDNIKYTNIQIMEVVEGEEREQGIKNYVNNNDRKLL